MEDTSVVGSSRTDKPKREPWEGGYKRRERDGRITFIIEREVAKHRFHISTRTHLESAAYAHLRRFEADPWAYAQEMREGRDPVRVLVMTADLVAKYREWMLNRDRPVTRKHANEMTHRLAEWEEDLRGRDLRRLDLSTLKAIVARREASTQHRIIALKGFFAWLRKERQLVERKDDATLDLAVPQAVPEKHRRKKAVPVEDVRAVLGHLVGGYRDALLLLAHAGWHVTELERFVRAEESRIAPGRAAVLAVLQVRHKTGATTRTPVTDAAALAAAERLRRAGTLPRRLNATIHAACDAAGVSRFGLGVLRHSLATWAIEAGTPADVVAEFLGHRDRSTTLRFYADVAVPTLPVRLPKF